MYTFAQDGSFAVLAYNDDPSGGNLEGHFQQTEKQILLLGKSPDTPTKNQRLVTLAFRWVNPDQIQISAKQGTDAEDLYRIGPGPAKIDVAEMFGKKRLKKLEEEDGPGTLDGDCKANVGNITHAILLYKQDFDDQFPGVSNCYAAVQPYLKRKDIFTCPALKAKGQHGGYAMNSDIAGKKFGLVGAPEGTLLVFEATVPMFVAADPLSTAITQPRHKHIYQGYADGHVLTK